MLVVLKIQISKWNAVRIAHFYSSCNSREMCMPNADLIGTWLFHNCVAHVCVQVSVTELVPIVCWHARNPVCVSEMQLHVFFLPNSFTKEGFGFED